MGIKERLTFEEATAQTLIACEHRHRYALATAMVRDLRVLDLCCGTGYGTAMLADAASSAHGVDNDSAAVDAAAAAARGKENVSFEVADALEVLSRPDLAQRYDAIVCFEGLEHLPHVERVLEQLTALANAGVRMVISVPNSRGLDEQNEFHLTDFSWELARSTLGALPGATLITQHLAEGSLILGTDVDNAGAVARVRLEDRQEPEYANHYIAVVGLEPSSSDASMRVEVAPVANRYMRSLESANATLRRTNQTLAREHLGKSSAAAGALAAKHQAAMERTAELEARLAQLGREHDAWIERCHGAEAREERLEARVAALERRYDSYLVAAWTKLRGR